MILLQIKYQIDRLPERLKPRIRRCADFRARVCCGRSSKIPCSWDLPSADRLSYKDSASMKEASSAPARPQHLDSARRAASGGSLGYKVYYQSGGHPWEPQLFVFKTATSCRVSGVFRGPLTCFPCLNKSTTTPAIVAYSPSHNTKGSKHTRSHDSASSKGLVAADLPWVWKMAHTRARVNGLTIIACD